MSEIAEAKAVLRREALARRAAQLDKEETSQAICSRLRELEAFRRAHAILVYVSARSEVRTRPLIEELLESDCDVIVPWCDGDELRLFQLKSMDDLALGAFGIDEPRRELRADPLRVVQPAEVQLAVVPGVAFDVAGGRLGHGRGYYDRLLRRLLPGVCKLGLAYECQVFPPLPTEPHDVQLDAVVTEARIYRHSRPLTP